MPPRQLRYGLILTLFLCFHLVKGKSEKEERSEEMAYVITGMYKEFNFTDVYRPIVLGARLFNDSVGRSESRKPAIPGICPSELKLKVKEKRGDLTIKLPKHLKAVKGDCPPAPGFEKTRIELVDYSQHPGLPEMHLLQGEFYVATLPHTLLQCPGDSASPITGLELYSLKTLLAPKIREILRQLGVPDFVIDEILDFSIKRDEPLDSEIRQRWDIPYIKRVVKAAEKEIEKLEEYYILVLTRQNEPKEQAVTEVVDPFIVQFQEEMKKDDLAQPPFGIVRQFRIDEPNCVYLLDGTPAEAEIRKKMESVVAALFPLFGHSRWSNMPVPSLTLHYTDSRCIPDGRRSIQTLSLSKPPEKLASLLSERDLVNWFTVSVNGEACTSARMESVLEMDYHPMKSANGLAALSLSRDIVVFLENQRKENHGPTKSPLRNEYRDLASRLLDSLAKASIFVARVDLGSCFQIDNNRVLDLLIVHRPAAHLYCTGFPGLGKSFSYNCGGPPSDLEESPSKQYSAFLVQKNAESKCLYSSSEFAASMLRGDIVLPSEEPAETSDPIVIETSGIEPLPTFIPIL